MWKMSRSFSHLRQAGSPVTGGPFLSLILCVDGGVVSHAMGSHIKPSRGNRLTLLHRAAVAGERKKRRRGRERERCSC